MNRRRRGVLPRAGLRSRRNWRVRVGVAGVAVVAVLTVASELWLPSWASARLEEALYQALAPAGVVDVKARSFPAFRLLAGRVDRFYAESREFPVGGLQVEALIIDGRGMAYDAPALYRHHTFRLLSADSLRVTLVVNESALNQFFWAQADPAHRFRLALADETARLNGSVDVLGRKIEVVVSGRLVVRGPNLVAFEPERLALESLELPRFVLNWLAGRWAIRLDFGSLPFDLELTGVRIQGGRLYVYGKNATTGQDEQAGAG